MREIAPLRILALRAVGPPGCQPEVTFGGPPRPTNKKKDGDTIETKNKNNTDNNDESTNSTTSTRFLSFDLPTIFKPDAERSFM